MFPIVPWSNKRYIVEGTFQKRRSYLMCFMGHHSTPINNDNRYHDVWKAYFHFNVPFSYLYESTPMYIALFGGIIAPPF